MRGVAQLVLALALSREASADERGVAYGMVGAEITAGGVIAIHSLTESSPGKGAGLALNYLPVVVGIGTGFLAEKLELDARPALGVHGAVIGALPMMLIGASIDGRDRRNGARLGAVALTLGALGAIGGAYLGATRVETTGEAIAVSAAPFAGAFAGGLTFAVVHFIDDTGPKGTGRLLRFVGAGMVLGTIGSFAYAFKDRDEEEVTMRTNVLSIGGVF